MLKNGMIGRSSMSETAKQSVKDYSYNEHTNI